MKPESHRGSPFAEIEDRWEAVERRTPLLPEGLEAIVAELREADRQERIDLLLDFSRRLPPLPERLAAQKDAAHRVEECQSPVYLFVELLDDQVILSADAPVEAPTVRGFVSLLIEGLKGATVEEVLRIPNDLVERCGLPEILGMLRVRGLSGVLRRVKTDVLRARASSPRRDSAGDGT